MAKGRSVTDDGFRLATSMRIKGFVYLIGAGPGAPGLLTLAGAEALRQATAVVHDALVSRAILDLANPAAQFYDVGKRPGDQKVTQGEIESLLIALAREDHIVARVKGGDPFLFGRGGEEVAALYAAGVPFRVIPGVTSALAVPAAAGIPVTHRRVAASVGIVTAHRMDGATAPDWSALARIDTIVVLMGAELIAQVAARFIQEGLNPETPVACIQSGTLPEQVQVFGTLGDIAERVNAAGLGSPMVTIIGKVVMLREQPGHLNG